METVQAVQADLMRKLQTLAWAARKFGPYLALEILMPGGTLLALLLFLYRRRHAAPDGRMLALRDAAARLTARLMPALGEVRTLTRLRAHV